MRSAVAGATFMNEFVLYAMQAPPLKRRTRQRFTEFDYNTVGPCVGIVTSVFQGSCMDLNLHIQLNSSCKTVPIDHSWKPLITYKVLIYNTSRLRALSCRGI